jgi:hypothetical protein
MAIINKDKMTSNDLQNTTKTTKAWATEPTKNWSEK